MSNSIDEFRELIKTYEEDKLPWVHVHLDDGKELLAHIERLEAAVQAVKDWDIENFKERGAFVVPQEIRQTIQTATRGEGE